MLFRSHGKQFAVLLDLVDHDFAHDTERLEYLGVGNGKHKPFSSALALEYPLTAHESCLLVMGVKHGFVEKSGSWYLYAENGNRLGQGSENAKKFLRENPDIAHEIESKVPRLLKSRRYFPNGDHGIQPLVTFPNLCRFMTLLHEVTGNPEGEFPRIESE